MDAGRFGAGVVRGIVPEGIQSECVGRVWGFLSDRVRFVGGSVGGM